MSYIIEKTQEIFSHLWIKTIAFIPVSFLSITDKEETALIALITIISLDLIAGMAVAKYVRGDFCWGILGSKFVKKFILYFIGLSAGHIASKGYLEVDFIFYWLMFVVTVSEFGSLGNKLDALGFPNPISRWAANISCYIESQMKIATMNNNNACAKTEEVKK